MDDGNFSALRHEHRTRSLGTSADSPHGVSIRSSKSLHRNAGSSRTGSVSFSRCSSGRFSKSSGTMRGNASEEDRYYGEDFAKLSSGNHSYGANDRFGSASASGYDDVFGGPPKYASPKFKTQPSMYEEIFRMPPKVLSASKLSDLPVFDPPSYSNDEIFGDALVYKGSAAAAAVRYEDIFGGGLPIGPNHVGANDLFGTLETRSMPSTSRFQSAFKLEGFSHGDSYDLEPMQNKSFGKSHRSLRRKSLNSLLRKKEEKTQESADCKSEQLVSNSSSSSSTVSFNDVNLPCRPESSSERASNVIPKNVVLQRDSTEGSTQHSFSVPGAAFNQTPSSIPARESFREAHVAELPKVKLYTKNDSIHTMDWLESNDAVLQRPKHKESRHKKHSVKGERTLLSPKVDDSTCFDEHFISLESTRRKIQRDKRVWLTVDNLKLTTNPTSTPPPARSPPSRHRTSSSVTATESESELPSGNAEVYGNGQVRRFAGANQQTSLYEHNRGFKYPPPARAKTSVSSATFVLEGEELATDKEEDLTTDYVSAVNLHSKRALDSSTLYSGLVINEILPQREEGVKLEEPRKETEEEEYASVDASVSSYEEVQNTSTTSSEVFTSDNLQQAEEFARLADASKERGREQLRSENGEPQEAMERKVIERNAKAVQESTHCSEKAGEAEPKEKHVDEGERKEEATSVWEKHREKREMKSSGLLEEREKQTKEAKKFSIVTDTKAVVEMERPENGVVEEVKKGAYWTEKASRIQELERRAIVDALERREKEVREERERERLRRERELERQREREREREKDRMEVERATKEAKEKAAVEAQSRLERIAVDARERAAMDRTPAEARARATSDRADRATVERVAAEARARAQRVAMERAQGEARGRTAERTAVERGSTDVHGRGESNTSENRVSGRGYSWKNPISTPDVPNKTDARASSAPRPRYGMPDFVFGKGFTNGEASNKTGVSISHKNASFTIAANDSRLFSDFPVVEGETVERRQARWERHQRTLERAAKALAEKNQRDREVQQEQAEKHRIAGVLDVEIRRWSAGKQGNLRALLSTLQNVLWRESGWQPVSLTDLVNPAAVKKAYRKATLCVHPDKVQQKGASVQQKYTAEKVFDLLKEAWNKFILEEQC